MWWFPVCLICWFIYNGYLGDVQASYECVFQIHNRSHRHVTVSTAQEIGENLATFEVIEILKKRRKREVHANDLILATSSSYFSLSYEYYGKWHLVLTNCLDFVQTEILQVTLGNKIGSGEGCGVQKVNITVDIILTKPSIIAPGNLDVNISSCKPRRILDVHQIRFNNTTQCTQFECFVRCTNTIKDFWLDSGLMIQTSADNINFNHIYFLQVACTDVANNETDIKFVGSSSFQVAFKNDNTCMETTTTLVLNITTVASSSQITGTFYLSVFMSLYHVLYQFVALK